MVHNHLAKQPAHPLTHLPDYLSTTSSSVHANRIAVIQIFSEIILKLLVKTPEDRYQSAAGLCSDLEHCLQTLRGILYVLCVLCG